MSLLFGNPRPPIISDPALFFLGFVLGLGVVTFGTFVIDKLGTAMFKRGFAKPFYVKGRRVHHRCLYYIVPTAYSILAGLFFLGYVQPIWSSFWERLGYVFLLIATTIAVDFLGDKFWPKIRMNVILHHEWIYTIVPLFIFTYVVNVVV